MANLRVFLKVCAIPVTDNRSRSDSWQGYKAREMDNMFNAYEEVREGDALYPCRHNTPEDECQICDYELLEALMTPPESENHEIPASKDRRRAQRRRSTALHQRRRVKVADWFNRGLLTDPEFSELRANRPWHLYSKSLGSHFGFRRRRGRRPDWLRTELDQAGLELAGM